MASTNLAVAPPPMSLLIEEPTILNPSGSQPSICPYICGTTRLFLAQTYPLILDWPDCPTFRLIEIVARSVAFCSIDMLDENLDSDKRGDAQVLSKYLIQKSKQAAGDLALKAPFKTHELDVAPPASPSLHAPTQPLPGRFDFPTESILESFGGVTMYE